MSLKNRTIAAVAPFAHLLGLARAEDDDTARKGKGAKRAEEDEKDEKEKGTDKDEGARKAEDDDKKDPEGKRAEDDDEKDKPDSRKGKAKSESEEDDEEAEDDDSDEEMRGSSAAAKARRRERARCKAIFSCDAAGLRPDVAATLAFNTTMSRAEAISVLTSTAAGTAPVRGGLAGRMAGVQVPQAGAEAGSDEPVGMSKVAAAIVAAGEKARGK